MFIGGKQTGLVSIGNFEKLGRNGKYPELRCISSSYPRNHSVAFSLSSCPFWSAYSDYQPKPQEGAEVRLTVVEVHLNSVSHFHVIASLGQITFGEGIVADSVARDGDKSSREVERKRTGERCSNWLLPLVTNLARTDNQPNPRIDQVIETLRIRAMRYHCGNSS